jgi:polyhydroxyalkanoate synthesis repressor PhaR
MKAVEFRVVDTSTDEDITRAILLQIMLEEESAGKPLFSSDMLAQIIRFYGGTLQGLFARYLEQSLNVFAKQQHQVRDALGKDPLEAVARITQRSIEMWADFQKDFLRAAGFAVDNKSDKSD